MKGTLRKRYLETSVLVIGGGAGARAAIAADKLGIDVLLIDKGFIGRSGATSISIGGIAAVADPRDTPEAHFRDTIIGGGFLNNQCLVEIMVNEGPEKVLELEKYGMIFMRRKEGAFRLGQSGGHAYPMILFEFYPDKVGQAMMRALKSEFEFLNLRASGKEFREWLEKNYPESYDLISDKTKADKYVKEVMGIIKIIIFLLRVFVSIIQSSLW